MNTGLTETQMKQFISVLEYKVGKKEAERVSEILRTALSTSMQSSRHTKCKCIGAGDISAWACHAEEMGGRYVRLAEIEIDPSQLEGYKAAVKEETRNLCPRGGRSSGLICRVGKDNPAHISSLKYILMRMRTSTSGNASF